MPKAKIVDGAVKTGKRRETGEAKKAAPEPKATAKPKATVKKSATKPKAATADPKKARGAKTATAKTQATKTQAKTSGSRKASAAKTGTTSTRATPRTPSRRVVRAESRPDVVAVEAGPPSGAGTALAPATTPATRRAAVAVPARDADPQLTKAPARRESRLLLLVRDPNTLFATWDMDPSASAALRERIGSRAMAVSTLTIRLTSAGGGTRVVHVSRRAKSRYLKADGAPSFVAEIGFTTPTGRYEFIARSAPCFVPAMPSAQPKGGRATRPATLGYREARALARRGLLFSSLRENMQRQPRPKNARAKPASAGTVSASSAGASPQTLASIASESPIASPRPTSLTSRVLGGASDLYRR